MHKLEGTAFLVPEPMLEVALEESAGASLTWDIQVEELRILIALYGENGTEAADAFGKVRKKFGFFHIREGRLDAGKQLFLALRKTGKTFTCAESLTGGYVSKLLTDIPGSSDVFWGGFVTYSNGAKIRLLKVRPELINTHGAVSREVVIAMAEGALQQSEADIALSISGLSGPGGGSLEKPVGTVWMAVMTRDQNLYVKNFFFQGSRDRVRKSVAASGMLITEALLLHREWLDSMKIWQYS
ncbi:MAG: CinA family protein [Spirochaetota bacterium]